MENKKNYLVLSITLLLISCAVFVFPMLINIDNNDTDTVIIDNKEIDENLENDSKFISEYVNIELDLNDFKALSKQDMIATLNLGKDYYSNEDNIKKLIDNGATHYELIAKDDSGSSVMLRISKPPYTPSINDFERIFVDEKLEEINKDYVSKGYTDVSINPHTKKFLKEDCFTLDSEYKDSNGNHLYSRSIYLLNNKYLGEIVLLSNNKSKLDDMEGYFKTHEIKN